MFRPVVAIIRSLSFDSLKIVLYSCVAACLMRRSQHQNPCLSIIQGDSVARGPKLLSIKNYVIEIIT